MSCSENLAGAVQRVNGVVISRDLAIVLVHYLGRLAELLARQNGCAPDALVSVQRALAEACAGAGDDSRHASSESIGGPDLLAFEHDFVDTQTAAALLRIKPDTVRWHCKNGALERRKVGRHVMVTKSSIESFKHERRSA
jgi:hypothetical protein